ncbi:unnamed protein product [Mytilus coruscus]|uniref:Integrase catalytic domain-containing protein n=1 Tax=Mytilus coruscus TaxID=42192 RepID=A0A6J8CDR0_MYTCO|nr:unnamed protein product [Mytilus coruscus]
MICFGRINGDVNGMIGIVEPKGQLTSKYSVIPARVLTKACDKGVVFKVLNPTSKPVKLFKDTNIGTFEEIDKVLDEEYNSDVVPTSHVVNSLCEGISKERMQDVQVDWEQLSNSEQEQLSELLNEFSDIFAKSDSDLGKTNLVSHSIDTQGHGAVKQRPYSVPFSQREEIRTQQSGGGETGSYCFADGIKADPGKVEAVDKFPTPRNVRMEDCEIAFNSLKRALVTSPVLQYPDFEKPFILYCDACDIGVGAVLAQTTDPNEKLDNPIGYASRQLRKHALNYAVIEKEALAIVWAVDHFRQYLYGHKFTVITDHNPLRWLMTIKNPSGRLARWSLALQEYDLTIEYRSGKLHGNADGLSTRGETQNVVAGLTEISPAGLQLDVIKDLQIKDPNLRPIVNYLKDGNLPEQITNARKVMACSPDYELFDGILHHFWKPDYLTKWTEAVAVRNADAVTTSKLFVEEIVCRHSAPRTLLSDRGQNFMSNLLKEICKLVNTKKIFTTANHPQCDGQVEKFNGVLTHMFVDDHHKNWDVYIPYVLFAYRSSIQESTQETPFYLMYGRDARLPIDVALSEPTVTYTDADDNKANVLIRLQEVFTLAKDNIQLAQQKQKAFSDKKSVEPDYEIGQTVWVYSPASKVGLSHKLLHPWSGPHRIISKISPVNFKIESCDNKKHQQILHANRIKPFLDPDDPPDAPNVFHDETDIQEIENPDQEDETIEDNDIETNIVVEVLDKLWTRNDEGRLEPKYFVKFENNTKENSWVKPDVIPGQLIEDFEENYKGRGASYRKRKV